MERKKIKLINGKEYKRGSQIYSSKERAEGYAKLLRDTGMNVVVDKFKEKSKFNNISYTYYFYWVRKKNKKRGK